VLFFAPLPIVRVNVELELGGILVPRFNVPALALVVADNVGGRTGL
jgi:hypothetical protein